VSKKNESTQAISVGTSTQGGDAATFAGEITFDLSRKLINVLGEDHYPYAEFLYHELAANAYDEDATDVQIIENTVQTKAPGRQAEYDIVVRDDGHGMDEAGLQEWFRLGDSSKPSRKISEEFKRPLIGQIGVGKVSILKAAREWTIETERHFGRDEPIRLRVHVNVDDWVSGRREGFAIERLKPEGRPGTTLTLHRVTTRLRQDRIMRHIQRLPLSETFKVFRNGEMIRPIEWYGIDCVEINKSVRWTEDGKTKTGRVHGEIWTRATEKGREKTAYIEEPKTEKEAIDRDAAGLEVRVNGDVIAREFFGHATHGHSVNRIWGWVDADFLPIVGNRTDYIRDHPAAIAFERAIQPLFTAAYNKVRYERDGRAKRRRETKPDTELTESQTGTTASHSGTITTPEKIQDEITPLDDYSPAIGADPLATRYGEVLNAVLEEKPELSFIVTTTVVPSPGRPAKDRIYPARPTGFTKPFLPAVTGKDLALIKSTELATVEQPAKGQFVEDSNPDSEFAEEMQELEIKAITPAGIRLRFIGLGGLEAPYRWNLAEPTELSLDINTDHALYLEVEKGGTSSMHRLLCAWIISTALAERRRPKVGASFAEDVETVCYELFTRLSRRR
jgi:hypothetical protein